MSRFDYSAACPERDEECLSEFFGMPSAPLAQIDYGLLPLGGRPVAGKGKTNYWWKKLVLPRAEEWTLRPVTSVFAFVDDYQIAGRFAEYRQSLTDLEDDWDGEGSQGYSDADWIRVEDFLVRHAKWLLFQRGIELPVPNISPSSGGTVDLHWQVPQFELLVNIPRERGTVVFYGDDYRTETIKGTFPVGSTYTALMEWVGSRIELASRANPR
jgi:hypothetical protein